MDKQKEIIKILKQHYNDKVISFGKFKGQEYENIPLYYLKWLLKIKDTYIKTDQTAYMFID